MKWSDANPDVFPQRRSGGSIDRESSINLLHVAMYCLGQAELPLSSLPSPTQKLPASDAFLKLSLSDYFSLNLCPLS
jgi:hypothetical protein